MEASPRLAQLVRDRKDRILAVWSARVRERPIAKNLAQPYLADSLPAMLDSMADTVEHGQECHAVEVGERAGAHARQRLGFGYDVGQLVAEYIDQREAIQEVLADVVDEVPQREWNTLNRVIDTAVQEAMERFSRARERKLRAFERISSEPLNAPNLEALLVYLLDALSAVAPEVDTVTILMREGNTLHVRASRGLEEEIQRGFTVAIGDGFAGTIAVTRQPLLLHDAAHDPLVKSEVIRRRGLKALYGVPLMDDQGDLMGVAHMGSTKAFEFQEEDLLLFRGLASRATSLIASRRRTDRLLLDEHQRERFIAILGHDLRSPLHVVVGSAHMALSSGNLGERERRAVARIARAGERMTRLVNDLLDFTRARVGQRIPLSLVWVDLDEVVRNAVEEQLATHPGREVRIDSRLRVRVCCDGERMAQVVSNLVGNALKHGAQDTPVVVQLEECGADAMLTVHNEGPPIPSSLLPHIFEPFRRGADDRVPGVGLGLYIAAAIVSAHHGSIEVESGTAGTTFLVRLPQESGCGSPR